MGLPDTGCAASTGIAQARVLCCAEEIIYNPTNYMKTTKVICDYCEKDLSQTGNCLDWMIALTNVRIPSYGGPVTDMNVEKPLSQDYHFCGLGCLRSWIAK